MYKDRIRCQASRK